MDEFSTLSDAERELDELRRRAYGRNSDIQFDRTALARLTELEAARAARPSDGTRAARTLIGAHIEIPEPRAVADGARAADSAWTGFGTDRPTPAADIDPLAAASEGSPRSLWQRLTATRTRRGWLRTGVLVAFACTVAWLVAPHPAATLREAADEGDILVLRLLEFLGSDADRSSIRGYEPYRGFEPWFSVEKSGYRCFMIVDRANGFVDGANCVPPGVDLFADIGVWPAGGTEDFGGLPDGSIIRFHYRGNSVDVYVYRAPEAD